MQTFLMILPYVIALVAIGGSALYQLLPARQKAEVDAWAQRYQFVSTIVTNVVQKTEQTLAAASGPEKKAAALDDIQAILTDLRIPIPATILDTLIEAAVSLLPHRPAVSVPTAAPSAPAIQHIAPTTKRTFTT